MTAVRSRSRVLGTDRARVAGPGLRLRKQVLPRNTHSATPLAWTHGQFIRLARSIDAGRPVETPRIVACRYRTTLCR